MSSIGYKQTPEHIARNVEAHRLLEKKRGSEHGNWKGDSAGKDAGRARARSVFKNIGPCVVCGSSATERHHVDENPLNNDPSNIEILCHKCHMGRHKKTHCCSGHLLSEDNVYMDHGKRYCRECRRLRSRNRIRDRRRPPRDKTKCRRGHPLSGDNLYLWKDLRYCRTCRQEQWLAKKRLARKTA